MITWYGEAEFNEAKKRKFVIDHHNNDGYDCRIENLSFIGNNKNKAKGLTYDKDRVVKQKYIAVNFYKDFKTKKYQVTLAFNVPTEYYLPNGKIIDLAVIKLLYEDNFEQVLLDCQNILLNKPREKFNLNKLSFIDIRYEEAQKTILKEEEKDASIIERDGRVCIVQGRDTIVISIPPDKDWN